VTGLAGQHVPRHVVVVSKNAQEHAQTLLHHEMAKTALSLDLPKNPGCVTIKHVKYTVFIRTGLNGPCVRKVVEAELKYVQEYVPVHQEVARHVLKLVFTMRQEIATQNSVHIVSVNIIDPRVQNTMDHCRNFEKNTLNFCRLQPCLINFSLFGNVIFFVMFCHLNS